MMIATWKGIAEKAGVFLGNIQHATGMDVGSRFMKSLMLQRGPLGPTLKGFAIEPVASGSNNDSRNGLPKDNFVQVLRNQFNPPVGTVGISVSGPQVLMKILTLPGMTEKDLREHLALELDRYIPLDVQDVVWDVYRHTAPVFITNEKREYTLVVAKKNFIEDRIQQFEHQGIQVRFVDVDILALVNMVAYNYGDEGRWLIVHLGPTGILSVVMEAGEPVNIRQVSYEVEWYGDLLDRVLLIYETADKPHTIGASETLLLQQFIEEVTGQVVEIIKHFSDISEKRIVRGVLLSGGYSRVEGLTERLADSLKMAVSLIDPFKKITVPPALQQDHRFQMALPLLGVAVGVAIRSARTP